MENMDCWLPCGKKEGPALFVVAALAADRDGQMESDVLAPMAAMAITVVWSKKVQSSLF